MKSGLNIPLTQQTTRRTSWRVVWMLAIFISSIIVIWLAVKLLTTTILSTPENIPKNTDSFLLLQKDSQVINEFHANVGQKQLLSEGPWTYDDLLEWSERSFILYFDNVELIGVAFDGNTQEDLTNIAEKFGFYVHEPADSKFTILTKEEELNSTSINVSKIPLISPRNNGIYTKLDDQSPSIGVDVTKNGIFFKGMRQPSQNSPNWSVAPDATILAHWSIENSASTIQNSLLSTNISQFGSHILFAEDGIGLVQYVSLTGSNLDIEQLVSIAESIVGQNALTTTAWTTEDGTSFDEIRVNSDLIETEIQTEQGITIITSRSHNNDVIRISKASDIITIANRDFSPNNEPVEIQSTCMPNAESILQWEELTNALSLNTEYSTKQSKSNVLTLFTEIVAGPSGTYLCW